MLLLPLLAASTSQAPPGLPELGGHYIGAYHALHLPEVGELHARARRSRSRRSHRGHDPFELSITAYGREMKLVLKNNARELFHPLMEVHVSDDDGERVLGYDDIDTSVFYGGHVDGDHKNSAIRAHVDIGGVLVGEIHAPHGKYYIERADRYIKDANFSNIIYRRSDVTENVTEALHHGHGVYDEMLKIQATHEEWIAEHEQIPGHELEVRKRRAHSYGHNGQTYNKSKHNTCFMAMVADQTFVKNDAGNSVQRAIVKLTQILAGATLVYTYTDFDNGIGTGIHFAVRRFHIFANEKDPNNPFSNPADFACGEQEAATSKSCVATMPCCQQYLDKLARWGGEDNKFDDVCLAHAFTHRDMCGGVLGLAWIGRANSNGPGICANVKSQGAYLNTGFSSTLNFGVPTSMAVQVVTLSHEMGHNFGSPHDEPTHKAYWLKDKDPSLKDSEMSCTPGTTPGAPNPEKGNYLMYYKATDGNDEYNIKFSPCSTKVIADVIVGKGPLCFENIDFELCGTEFLPKGDQFCGDGIIQENEDCDCGTDDAEECAKVDPCCTTECTLQTDLPKVLTFEGRTDVSGDAECSPLKDRACCTSACKMRGLSFEETLELYKQDGDNSADLKKAYKIAYTTAGEAGRLAREKGDDVEEGTEGADDADKTTIDDATGLTDGLPQCFDTTECNSQRYCIADRAFKGACPPRNFVYQPPAEDSPTVPKEQGICYDYGCDKTGRESKCTTDVDAIPSCFDRPLDDGGFEEDCYMFHKSKVTMCNDDKNYCRFSGCTGSLCSAWQATDVSGQIPSPAWLGEAENKKAKAERCRLLDTDVDFMGKECQVACRWQLDGGPCVSTSEYAKTAHARSINAKPEFTPVESKLKQAGMSCFYRKDPFGGRCNWKGEGAERKMECGSASVPITEELAPAAVARWIEANWGIVLGLSAGGVVLMFLLKYTYTKKEPAILRTAQKFFDKTIRNKRQPRKQHTATGHPVTSVVHEFLSKKEQVSAKESVKRLQYFFPGAKRDNVDVAKIAKRAENEREAVKKLLKMGYAFRVPEKVPLPVR